MCLVAVPVRRDGGFVAGEPTGLFEKSFVRNLGACPNFDVAADGRFVMVQENEPKAAERTSLQRLLDWPAQR